MHAVRVRVDEQPVPQEVRGAVTDEAVSLHLSHAQPTVAPSPLHGLPRKVHHGPPAPTVDLVVHQMLQALVERRPQENLENGPAGGGGVCTHDMRGRSRMAIDPRISTGLGKSTSEFHPPGRHCLHQALSAREVLGEPDKG